MEPHLSEPQISGYPDGSVSYREGEGALEVSLPPRNLEIEYGYYCFVTVSKPHDLYATIVHSIEYMVKT